MGGMRQHRVRVITEEKGRGGEAGERKPRQFRDEGGFDAGGDRMRLSSGIRVLFKFGPNQPAFLFISPHGPGPGGLGCNQYI